MASAPHSSAIPAKSIAVLPFENLSDLPENAYFSEGIQDEILMRLAKITDLKVISRASIQGFKSSPENLPQIARRLGVANILEGSVQKAADQVRVTVRLIRAETGAYLWAESYDRKLTDIFRVESEIAKRIADTLQARLTGSEQHALALPPTENTEAHQLYLKGRYFWNKRTGDAFQKALGYFKQAIEKDPNYALAYAGISDTYVLLPGFTVGSPQECYPKAIAAAKRALELDDTLAEAHTSLALALWFYEFDFAQANREFQRAIELNPNYATAHHWYGTNLLMPLGRFDEGIAEMKRAQELDPLSLIINSDLGFDYIIARRYDEAIEQLRTTIEMDPGFYYAHWNLGQAFQLKGNLPQAIAEYHHAQHLSDDPVILTLLGQTYAATGQTEEARTILTQLTDISRQRYVAVYNFALLHLALGNKEEAIRWLERSYQDRAGYDITWIGVDPSLDPLRSDPRFEKLVASIFSEPAK